MVLQIETEVLALAAACDAQTLPDVSGWQVDEWKVSNEALTLLRQAYQALLNPIVDEVARRLQEDGVDVDELLAEEGPTVDDTTRADAVELLAVAAAVKRESLDPQFIHMPNVPKMSRRYSSRGLDVLGFLNDPNHDGPALSPDERLFIYSVKHTVSDVDDLVTKLRGSLSEGTLTPVYLFGQLRVLHGRLGERGHTCDRLYSILPDFHEQTQVVLIAVAAADTNSQVELNAATRLLPATTESRRLRSVLVPQIATLHDVMASSD